MAKKLLKITYTLLLVTFLTLNFSCKKNNNEVIILDESNPLALAPDITWAVIIEQYASFKEEKDWASGNSGHVRKGQILQVEGKALDTNGKIWYLFDEGWLPENSLKIYSNRLKAESAVKEMEGTK